MAEGIETQRHRDTEESQNCWKARIVGKPELLENKGWWKEWVMEEWVMTAFCTLCLCASVPLCFKKGLGFMMIRHHRLPCDATR